MSQRFDFPREQVFTDLGAIGAGFRLYTYETTTTTPLATYSDVALTVANANPTIADSAGRFGDIFVDDLKLYKAILKDADDNTVWTADPVDPKTFSIADFDPRPTSFWGTTSGISTAYELIADPIVTAYSSTQTFFLAFNVSCGAAPTLTYVAGGAVLNLKKSNGAGGKVALEVDDVLAGSTYEARNDGTDVVILNPEITQFSKNNDLTINNKFNTKTATTIISSGAIDYEEYYNFIDGEGAADDTLTTINGGVEGDHILLNNSTNTIIIESGTGNISLPNDDDVTLINAVDVAELVFDGTSWILKGASSTSQDFLNLKSPNGYTYLPNGILFQWGVGVGPGVKNFPIAFPNACVNVSPTNLLNGTQLTITYAAAKNGTITTTSFQALIDANNADFNYIAIGY